MNTETERKTLAEFIRQNRIVMVATPTDNNPCMDDRTMDHWKCKLICSGRRMTLTFSKGSGHHGKQPETAEVLDCLASDASGCAEVSFEDWCGEYGYDTDSRKAEKVYKACIKQSAQLLNLLGQTEYEALLWNMERE